MGNDVETKGAAVAADVGAALADDDLVEVVGDVEGAAVEPVLRGGVAVAEDDGGQAGDGVVAVGHAPLGAGLGADEVGKGLVADARGAVGVQVDGVAVSAEVRGREGRHGAAERVAGGHDLVARVGLGGGGDGGLDAGANLDPGVLEARVDVAVVDEGALGLEEVDVGDPVADVAAAADGHDDFLAGVVGCDVATNA